MSLHKYIERIKYIDYLIRKRATGNADCLAKKLNLSKSGVEKFIQEMKEVGFPIVYCRKRKTYVYEEKGKMVENLFYQEIDNVKMKDINGGKTPLIVFQVLSDHNYSRFCEINFGKSNN